MRPALVLKFATLVAGDVLPQLGWDPETVKSCAGWYDNAGDVTCEYVRQLFGIPAEMFTQWNPSINLDCKPWRIQSYCIITQERVDEYERTHGTSTTTSTSTTKSITTRTSTTSTLGPSPTKWTELGCYNQGIPSILEERITTEGGDDTLTIPKCQDICYHLSFYFAAVKSGNECWCSSYIGGEYAKNAAECNRPCAGDKTTICGGKDRFNIFEAKIPEPWESMRKPTLSSPAPTEQFVAETTEPSSTIKEMPPAPRTTQSTSGGSRNIGIF
ncbi:WSC domain protein [Metarhizium robertsii]|uniref:Carbohydrate-binding WSC n=3 Tax=Metarhizium TaxID=5529 RepID=E9EK16_METRA|nr:Carbohydrate-binding WSC [Metarhizium robertsii ARSEF 23]EFZ03027.1 Carbohydrate-binding WSC [Metarhizium robertsii ARSEF 23]EXV05282.1 WSC domain protein [Metarhizium robertsii]KID82719.1 Carbohydrate-binding WSC [Metarhizium guizhouense ARSEF 977]